MNPGQETTDNLALRQLRDSVVDLNESTKSSGRIMTCLTIILVILTIVMIIPIIVDLFK